MSLSVPQPRGAARIVPRTLTQLVRRQATQFTLVIELVVIFVLFQITTDGVFLTSRNLSNLLMQSVTFALIAIPMVLVMVQGHIDLSVGSVLGFLGTAAATFQVDLGLPTVPAVALTLVLGILVGLWHGYWVAYRNMPAFIVTLTGLLVFKGLNLLVGDGASVGPVSDSFGEIGSGYLPDLFFGNDTTLYVAALIAVLLLVLTFRGRRSRLRYGLDTRSVPVEALRLGAAIAGIAAVAGVLFSYRGLSYPILLLIVVAAAMNFIADNTAFGRHVYAIGGNKEAAGLSGVDIPRTTMKVFFLMGLLTAVASVVFLGRVGEATALSGVNFEFTVITGCIVGGVSTLGGHGRIVGAIIGTILMASLDNGMSLLNLGTTWQFIAKGLVLLFAVAIDVMSRKNQ